MMEQSVWLGAARRPMRAAAIGFAILTLAIAVLLVIGQFTQEEPAGMFEMLRPQGHPMIYAILGSLTATLFFAALYYSDIQGAIEIERTGPFDIISLIASRLAMMSVAFIVMVMFYEVVLRYVFGKPTLWANELSLWIAAFVFLLAGLYAMQQRSHIRIYIIYDMMPRWLQKLSDCISVFLIWAFAFCLVWGGYNEAKAKLLRMETFGTAWDPPIPATIKPAILFIICLVAIQALSNLIADWHKAPEHHSPADEIDETEIENIRRTLEGQD